MRGLARVRRGFTLLELVVALSIAALALGIAGAALKLALDGVSYLQRSLARTEDRLLTDDFLRRVTSRVDPTSAEQPSVLGGASWVRLRTWCDASGGWLEQCVVDLIVTQHAGPMSLDAVVDGGNRSPVWHAHPGEYVGFIFLRDAYAGGSWSGTWNSVARLPQAIGLIRGGDTLLLRIGERG